MTTYIQWVVSNPLFSAAVQFAILGTLGELLSHVLRTRTWTLPCKIWQVFAKIAAWAVLGIIIKYGFTGMYGFVDALVEHELLPRACHGGIGWAIAMSVSTNVFFGPQMMFIHRLEDNLIAGRWSTAGLTRAWWTLLWFWIPAHIITFSLPKDYQIGLAALWSVVLGLIMGLTAPRK
ncbi:hypothetical protein KKH27_05995 [bacterium]|nr:hypothetical protein [bacterium]MBU1984764.1 hypothetical protein [bacterium]